MIEISTPDEFQRPDADAKLWRYMNFYRLKQLVEGESIYLSRVDKFSDFVESNMSERAANDSRDELARQGDDGRVADALQVMSRLISANMTYAMCWNTASRESNLMWRAYGAAPDEATEDQQFKIAISTTVASFIESLNSFDGHEGDQHYIGMVKYIDYETDSTPGGIVDRTYVKRLEYQEEKECRFAIIRTSNMPGGLLSEIPEMDNGIIVPVKLEHLIKHIAVELPSIDDQVKLGISGTEGRDQASAELLETEIQRRLNMVLDLVRSETSLSAISNSTGVSLSTVL